MILDHEYLITNLENIASRFMRLNVLIKYILVWKTNIVFMKLTENSIRSIIYPLWRNIIVNAILVRVCKNLMR